MELFVFHRLLWYLEQYTLAPCKLSGFQKGRPTVDAISDLATNLEDAKPPGDTSFEVFLDVSRAFDSLPPVTIPGQLRPCGVSGRTCSFIAAFPRYRSFIVHACGVAVVRRNLNRCATGKCPEPVTSQSGYDFDCKGQFLTFRAFLFVLPFMPIVWVCGVSASPPKPKPSGHGFRNSCSRFLSGCRSSGSAFPYLRLRSSCIVVEVACHIPLHHSSWIDSVFVVTRDVTTWGRSHHLESGACGYSGGGPQCSLNSPGNGRLDQGWIAGVPASPLTYASCFLIPVSSSFSFHFTSAMFKA